MARNEDMGWGRFDNDNTGRASMPSPAPANFPSSNKVTPNKAAKGTRTIERKKVKIPAPTGPSAPSNPYEALRGNLQAGLNQAQQGAFARGPAGYAQAGTMADRVHNMLSYDMPQQSTVAAPKKTHVFGQALGHAIISTLQFGNQVRLGMQGRGPGQPNERRKPSTPFAGNRSGTTKPYGRSSVYNVLNQSTY